MSRTRIGLTVSVIAASMLISGCVGTSPTYGTGKPADEQLFDDISGVFALAPKRGERIEYKPRPEIVTPAQKEVLPAPQSSLVTASNPQWPESPEERRKRYRDAATENQDNAFFDPIVEDDLPKKTTKIVSTNQQSTFEQESVSASQRAEFRRRLQESKTGDPNRRRYLSEPPTEYRQPSATAPVDDLGEDEWKKEKRLKRQARKNKRWRLRDLAPWL